MPTKKIGRAAVALVLTMFAISVFIPTSYSFATSTATVNSPYYYTFNSDGTLLEAGSMNDSGSGYWWVNSGAKLQLQGGSGMTAHGLLPAGDYWRNLYNSANPVDTDLGTHPQNLFRLVSRNTWSNVHVESMFKIDKDNFSLSPNRNASNGLLLMLRYADAGQTLYYFGIRVDGSAIIKKKYKGTYYTVATKTIFPGTYVLGGTVNLLPHYSWLTLGADTVNNPDGSVSLKMYLQKPGELASTKIFDIKDTGQFGGTPPISAAGNIGIRTDFMDVSFDTFKAIKI